MSGVGFICLVWDLYFLCGIHMSSVGFMFLVSPCGIFICLVWDLYVWCGIFVCLVWD